MRRDNGRRDPGETGRKVLVLEQSERIGGCCSTFEKDGYCFDVGASIVELIRPIQDVFQTLGARLEDEISLLPCDPVMSVIRRDGSRSTYPLSAAQTGEVIAAISPEDGRRWPDFCTFCDELMEVTLATFFSEPAVTLSDMAAMFRKDPRLFKYLPVFLTSYEDVLRRFFKDERVLAMMTYQALYVGLPPALAPGPYAMLPYTEHKGVYYPRGGMIQIPMAIERVGRRYGLRVELGRAVERVLVRNGAVVGVRLAGGEEISAPIVVSNVNAKMLYLDMIGEENLPSTVARGIRSYRYSKAVPMIYCGVDYAPPLDAHHSHIAITPGELDRYWCEHVETGVLPERNFGLICWPTCTDPSLAPPGRHILNLIPEGFYRLSGTDWDTEKPRFVERTLAELSSYAVPGLADHVEVLECATPLDFERHAAARRARSTGCRWICRARRAAAVRGLEEHPEPLPHRCVHPPGRRRPTIIASGVIAARLIERYH